MSNKTVADDYKQIKSDCELNLTRLEANLSDLSQKHPPVPNIDNLLQNALSNLSRLDVTYKEFSVEGKRKMSSIFQGKLAFVKRVIKIKNK